MALLWPLLITRPLTVFLSITTNESFDSEPLSEREFRDCYDLHFVAVRNYIYYRYKDKEMAEDLAQDAFAKLWENRHRIRRETIRNFLYAVAANAAVTLFHRKNVQFTFESEYISRPRDNETPEDAIFYAEYKERLEKALSNLPDGAREVFLMSRLEDMKLKEIADLLGLSVKAIEKRITKARVLLKEQLGLDL